MRTWLSERFGLDVPVVCAPMAGAAAGELAAAVCRGAQAEMASASDRGDYDTVGVYAGQGAAMLTSQRPAAEVVADLATADRLLQRAAE